MGRGNALHVWAGRGKSPAVIGPQGLAVYAGLEGARQRNAVLRGVLPRFFGLKLQGLRAGETALTRDGRSHVQRAIFCGKGAFFGQRRHRLVKGYTDGGQARTGIVSFGRDRHHLQRCTAQRQGHSGAQNGKKEFG